MITQAQPTAFYTAHSADSFG